MESNDLRALSELYLKTVYEAKAESPEEEEEKDKEDDDLAGSPNKNGKKNGKKAKRWWDDDGDGKGYEKGEVDGKFPDKDGSKKKKDVKEAVYGGKKEAPKDNRMVLTHADKKANTPAWQNRDKKNPKTGESVYKKADHLNKEEVEVDEGYEEKKKGEVLAAMKKQGRKLSDKDKDKIANKVVVSKGDTSKSDDRYAYEELDPGMEHNLSILRMLAEKEVNVKDTKKVVDAIRAYDKSKDASRDATDDSDKGDKEGADVEKKYAAKERGEIKKDDPNWKNKKGHTGMHGESAEHRRNPEGSVKDRFKSKQTDPSKDNFTGIGDDIGEIMRQNAAMKKAAAAKKTKKEELELTGKFTAEEINSILEAERSIDDRLDRKNKLMDKTVKKAMKFARDEGEASGHARFNMSRLGDERAKLIAKKK